MSFSRQYANGILFGNQPGSFEALLLALFHVSHFICLPCTLVKSFQKPFFPPRSSPPIPQDIAAVNRFTFPHSKVRSAYVFPPDRAFHP